MATRPGDEDAIRAQLDRVLSSRHFARSERVSKLLRFLVERQSQGKEDQLKESLIGVEVFGRPPDYDTKLDSTVRTEAARIRARLTRYYASEGSEDPLIIELPKGGYVPRYRQPELAPPGRQPAAKQVWLGVVLAAAAVISAAISAWWLHQKNTAVRIGVLPLVNLNHDTTNDYLADGLTSEIIRDLSIIDGLTVRSQTSSFALKGRSYDVHEAASQLDADYILEGSVLRDGRQLRINAQVVRVRGDSPVWSGNFERELAGIISVQGEISRGIVNGLRLKLGRGRRRYETSAEAYDLYLQAVAAGAQHFPGDPEVIHLFEKVLERDASFAPASAGLAAAYAWRSFQSPDDANREEELNRMQSAAEMAIKLDPLLPEAYTALGTAYARNGQWTRAEPSFRRALEIEPNSSFAHGSLALFALLPLGRIKEAVREMSVAEENDPLSPRAHRDLAGVLFSAGRLDEAAAQCESLPADSFWWGECLGRVRVAQGRVAEAIPLLAGSRTDNWGYLAYAYAKSGRRVEAEKLMAEAPILHPNRRGPFQFALAYAGLKDRDRTVEQLERMAGVGPVRLGFTLNSPEFAFVRSDARVKSLRRNLGLPE
jgi:TolB-like protein/Flp pilus assembly protein TadD